MSRDLTSQLINIDTRAPRQTVKNLIKIQFLIIISLMDKLSFYKNIKV